MNFKAGAMPYDPPVRPRSATPIPLPHVPSANMRRLTIAYNTRTITLTVSDGPIVADLLPDIARRLGVLDPSIVYGLSLIHI